MSATMSVSNSVRSRLLIGAAIGIGFALGLGAVVQVDRGGPVPSPARLAPMASAAATPIAAPADPADPACEDADAVADAVADVVADVADPRPAAGLRVRPAGEGGLFVLSGAPLPPDSAPQAFDAVSSTPTIAVDWDAVDWDAGYEDPAWFGAAPTE